MIDQYPELLTVVDQGKSHEDTTKRNLGIIQEEFLGEYPKVSDLFHQKLQYLPAVPGTTSTRYQPATMVPYDKYQT